MPYWFLLAFVMGWIVGLGLMKIGRSLWQNDFFGILADCLKAWYHDHQPVLHLSYRKLLSTVMGAAVCQAAAAVACRVFKGSSGDALVPLGFILIVVVCAYFFGALAGVLGSLCAATTFAIYLFPPEGFAVESQAARATLGLMVFASAACSWFLAASRQHKRMRTAKTAHS